MHCRQEQAERLSQQPKIVTQCLWPQHSAKSKAIEVETPCLHRAAAPSKLQAEPVSEQKQVIRPLAANQMLKAVGGAALWDQPRGDSVSESFSRYLQTAADALAHWRPPKAPAWPGCAGEGPPAEAHGPRLHSQSQRSTSWTRWRESVPAGWPEALRWGHGSCPAATTGPSAQRLQAAKAGGCSAVWQWSPLLHLQLVLTATARQWFLLNAS